jgi:chemotaxis signal transduction protein
VSESLQELVPAAVIQVDSLEAALPASVVEKLVALPGLVRVPMAPAGLAGIAILEGEPVPVVDLCEILCGHRAATSPEAAVVCRTASRRVALVGARVRSIDRLRRAPQPVALPEASSGVELRGRAVPLIDLDRLCDALRKKAPARREPGGS